MRPTAARPVSGRGLAAAGLALLAAPTSGCPTRCVGVGCEETYDGALAAVHRGADVDLTVPMAGPFDEAWVTVEGTADEGPDWALALGPESLYVGSPEEAMVRRIRLERSRTEALDESKGQLEDAEDSSFGAAIDLVSTGEDTVELLVGAPGHDRDRTSRDEGEAWLFRGLAADWEGTLLASDELSASIGGTGVGAGLGEVVALCGDLDGDGLGDWIAAAPAADAAERIAGEAWLVLAADETARGSAADASATWEGQDIGGRLGSAVTCRADLTGDGLGDAVLTAPFADGDHEAEGVAVVIAGAARPASGDPAAVASAVLRGRTAEAWFGWSAATGDLDLDGVPDLAVGSPGAQEGAGEVLVWDGAALSLDPARLSDYRLAGAGAGDRFGSSVAIADLDGDSAAELLVGAPARNPTGADNAFNSGALYVFLGAVGLRTWRGNMSVADAATTLEETRLYLRTGQRVSTGDFDADGRQDLALLHRWNP